MSGEARVCGVGCRWPLRLGLIVVRAAGVLLGA